MGTLVAGADVCEVPAFGLSAFRRSGWSRLVAHLVVRLPLISPLPGRRRAVT
jgi:hypothetical protein